MKKVERYKFELKGKVYLAKQYAVFKSSEILKMSTSKGELIDYIKSFPEQERKDLRLAERYVSGSQEHQKGFWQGSLFDEEK
jgi:hypothetical protein